MSVKKERAISHEDEKRAEEALNDFLSVSIQFQLSESNPAAQAIMKEAERTGKTPSEICLYMCMENFIHLGKPPRTVKQDSEEEIEAQAAALIASWGDDDDE